MTHPLDLSPMPLARRALLTLEGGKGKAVGVFSGRIWITEERTLDDHVLGPGDSMALRRPGLVVVEGLQDSQILLFDTDPSAVRPQEARATLGASAGTATGLGKGGGPDRAEPTGPSLMEYERRARALRRQAHADALRWLLRALGRLLAPPASPPPPMPRPGGPALAGRAPR